jgi:hypothetical protein
MFFTDLPAIVLLSVLVGWQSLSGAFVIIILSFLILLITKNFANLRIKQASVTDKRLSALSEIIARDKNCKDVCLGMEIQGHSKKAKKVGELCSIFIFSSKHFLIVTLYRPPDSSIEIFHDQKSWTFRSRN